MPSPRCAHRSGAAVTNDEPKYSQADVATKVVAILG